MNRGEGTAAHIEKCSVIIPGVSESLAPTGRSFWDIYRFISREIAVTQHAFATRNRLFVWPECFP